MKLPLAGSRIALLSTVAMVFPCLAQEDTSKDGGFHIEFTTTTSAATQNVGGNKALSTLEQDYSLQANNQLTLDYLFLSGKELKLDLSWRDTNDVRIDDDPFEINSIAVKFLSKEFQLTLGDTAASFSTYSLSQSLKGLNMQFGSEKNVIKVVAGTSAPEWRFPLRVEEGDAAQRIFEGVRLEHKLDNDAGSYGASLAHARDNLSTAFDPSSQIGKDLWSLAADSSLVLSRIFSLKAEAGASSLDEDIGAAGGKKDGAAGLASLTAKSETVNGSASFENVSNDFSTSSGTTSKGLRRSQGNVGWEALTFLTAESSIAHQKTGGESAARSTNVQLSSTLHDIKLFPGWKLQGKGGGNRDSSIQSDQVTVTREQSITSSNTVLGVDGAITYGRRKGMVESIPATAQTSRTFGMTGGLPLNFILKDAGLSLQAGRDKTLSASAHQTDLTYKAGASLKLPVSERFSVGGAFSLTSTDRGLTASDSKVETYSLIVGYTFPEPTIASLSLAVSGNKNDADSAARTYSELTVTAGFSWTFK